MSENEGVSMKNLLSILIPAILLVSCSASTNTKDAPQLDDKQAIIECGSYSSTLTNLIREYPDKKLQQSSTPNRDDATHEILNKNRMSGDYVWLKAIPEAAEKYKAALDPIEAQKIDRSGEDKAREYFNGGDGDTASAYMSNCVRLYAKKLDT